MEDNLAKQLANTVLVGYDVDQDGYLSKEEFFKVCYICYKIYLILRQWKMLI
jgi:Ca2+-binding EF-hand superfamily protein